RSSGLRLRLIPKGMAGFVPIQLTGKQAVDCVLIDDDPISHLSWETAARTYDKRIAVFERHTDFLRAAAQFDSDIPIYIDVNLGDGVDGRAASREIHEKGFTSIYL